MPERFLNAWCGIFAEAEMDSDKIFIASTVHNAPCAFKKFGAIEAVINGKLLVSQLGPFNAFKFNGTQLGCYIAHTDSIDSTTNPRRFEQVWREIAIEFLFVGWCVTQANLTMCCPTNSKCFKDARAIFLILLSTLSHFY